ncbi:hypothetical protein JCM11641_001452, partial [Rhodosporidiobolus odoratus]
MVIPSQRVAPPSTQPFSNFDDVERQHSSSPSHAQPSHHSEAHLQETAVVWDDRLKRWQSHEEHEAASQSMGAEPEPVSRCPQHPPRDSIEEKDDNSSDATVFSPTGVQGTKGKMEIVEKVPTRMTVEGEKGREVIWLEFAEGDPENPYNWSQRRKWQTALIGCLFTLAVSFAGTSFAMGTGSLIKDFHCSREVATLGLSL